jgi:hypothetical protein
MVFATEFPERWPRILASCEGDEALAREFAANSVIAFHKPRCGPRRKEQHDEIRGFQLSFGVTFRWDFRRFMRQCGRALKTKRKARFYWRAMTKRVRHGYR